MRAVEEKKLKQPKEVGVGPEYHRIYEIEFTAREAEVKLAAEKLKKELNFFSPQWIATFEKITGSATAPTKKGEEFEVHLPGPWEAPVRVKSVGEKELALDTLEGHPEAGQIRFEVQEKGQDTYCFRIESFARSKDALVDLLYDKIPLIRYAQKEMWERYCLNFARYARHPAAGRDSQKGDEGLKVKVTTEKRSGPEEPWQSI